MKKQLLAVVLAAMSCHVALAQDTPITAPTASITILTAQYSATGGSRSCTTFTAQSVMNGIQQTLNIGGQGSGAGAGKITFLPFTIVKAVDTCSANLFLHAATGSPFQELIAVVESRGEGNRPTGQTYMIRLGLAAVSTLDDSASNGTTLLEKVSFQYGDLTIAEIDAVTGSLTSCSGWDRVRNTAQSNYCGELQTVALNRSRGLTR